MDETQFFRPKRILDEIERRLQTIIAGNAVIIEEEEYRFTSSLGLHVFRGREIKYTRLDDDEYPCCSITGVRGRSRNTTTQTARVRAIQHGVMTFTVEAMALVPENIEPQIVALELLEDIKNAIPLRLEDVIAEPLYPLSWDIREPEPGQQTVLVERRYQAMTPEVYPWIDVCEPKR